MPPAITHTQHEGCVEILALRGSGTMRKATVGTMAHCQSSPVAYAWNGKREFVHHESREHRNGQLAALARCALDQIGFLTTTQAKTSRMT